MHAKQWRDERRPRDRTALLECDRDGSSGNWWSTKLELTGETDAAHAEAE